MEIHQKSQEWPRSSGNVPNPRILAPNPCFLVQLALKHRQGKNHKMRIIAFVGSPVHDSDKDVSGMGWDRPGSGLGSALGFSHRKIQDKARIWADPGLDPWAGSLGWIPWIPKQILNSCGMLALGRSH